MPLSPSMRTKLDGLRDRFEEVAALLSDPEVMGARERFTALSREYAELEPVMQSFQRVRRLARELDEARELTRDSDPELRQLAEEDVERLTRSLESEEQRLQTLLLPRDPNDAANVFLEIRAGTGGDEAALFAGDLLRMYQRYADLQGWRFELMEEADGEVGGYKEAIARISGKGAYARLKYESGVHRVQRVPETEASGRIHTSAATVAVLPEVEDIDVEIRDQDIRIDTMRSSGAGGQHVNTTDSAVRITHLPTGIVVTSSMKSQHQNRAQAMVVLRARLYEAQREARDTARADARREQVGSGDRSERIRTYNFPQGRVTDHRINLTLYKLDRVLSGEALDEIVEALIAEDQAEKIASMQ